MDTKTIPFNSVYQPYFDSQHPYAILYGGAGCFDGDTLINTINGYKPIKDIEVGEKVLSLNEKTLELEYKQVVNKFCYKTDDIGQKMLIFELENQEIRCTHEHRFYYKGAWVKAIELAIRAMETRGIRKRELFYKQFREAFNDKSLWGEKNCYNETVLRRQWLLQNCHCNEKHPEQIINNKNSQISCNCICPQSPKPTRGQSQRWSKDEQQCGEFRVGYAQTKCSAFFCKQATNKYRIEECLQQVNGGRCNGNKGKSTSGTSKKTGSLSRKVWRLPIDNKGDHIQTVESVAACEIDINKILSIRISCAPQLVHDLRVDGNENYCITTDNIIVHNSGKSVAAAQKHIMRIASEMDNGFRHRILVLRKFKTSIRNSVFELLRSTSYDLGLGGYFQANTSDLNIRYWNDSEIITSGVDDVEKIKSIANITSVWIEEATELSDEEFKQINLRLRGIMPYYKQITLTFNPITELHWIKQMFFDDPNVEGRAFKLHTSYKDNHFLDSEYVQKLEEDYLYDENMYRIYVKGEWGRIKTGHNWYTRFDYSKHVDTVEYIPGVPLHISFDFNYNPYMPLGIFQVINDNGIYRVHMIDEIALTNPNNTTERICEVFSERYGGMIREPIFVYGDAHGKAHTPYSSMNHYDMIEKKLKRFMTNHSLRILPKNPSLEKRLGFINKVLHSEKLRETTPTAGYPIILRIDHKCKNMINDLESVSLGDEGKKVVRTKKDPLSGVAYQVEGHFSDLFDYLMVGLFENWFLDFANR